MSSTCLEGKRRQETNKWKKSRKKNAIFCWKMIEIASILMNGWTGNSTVKKDMLYYMDTSCPSDNNTIFEQKKENEVEKFIYILIFFKVPSITSIWHEAKK